ncbi:MAG: hypothetical protein ACK5WF_06335, partial [Cyclobacteriaceae bacterium]
VTLYTCLTLSILDTFIPASLTFHISISVTPMPISAHYVIYKPLKAKKDGCYTILFGHDLIY